MASFGERMGELALYIHIPFCRKKCIYCDFYSLTSLHWRQRYIKALVQEIDRQGRSLCEKVATIRSVYFGGGTPSLLTREHFFAVLQTIRNHFVLAPDVEITCEANPGTLSAAKLAGLRSAGVNRLTVGVQSFCDVELATLGRIHNADAARQSLRQAREAGFSNIAIDLIFAIPGQSLLQWKRNIAEALAFNPEHLSVYGLTVEAGTPLDAEIKAGRMHPCSEEVQRKMMLAAMHRLRAAGYEQYELSNYALPGMTSRHNQAYWQGLSYLGFGASAHSFDGRQRWWNCRDLQLYCRQIESGQNAMAERETLTSRQLLYEMILLGLRQNSGIDSRKWHSAANVDLFEFVQHCGLSTEEGLAAFAPSAGHHLLSRLGEALVLSEQGVLLYDSVCEKLVGGLA